MGRKSKFTPELRKSIEKLIANGGTDVDVCRAVGIDNSTLYLWLAIGNAIINDEVHARKPETEDEQLPYVEFVEAVSRARAKAQLLAIAAFRSGLLPSKIVQTFTETITETRLKKDGTEFEYKKTIERTSITKNPPDWRAGEAWAKRRDPDNWSGKDQLDVTSGGEKISLSADLLAELDKRAKEQLAAFERELKQRHE